METSKENGSRHVMTQSYRADTSGISVGLPKRSASTEEYVEKVEKDQRRTTHTKHIKNIMFRAVAGPQIRKYTVRKCVSKLLCNIQSLHIEKIIIGRDPLNVIF